MGYHYTILLAVIPVIISGYIIDNGRQPDCWGIVCQNDGILDKTTCTCLCHVNYTGLFCETEVKDTQWPHGRYSMLSTVFGCPEDLDHGWHTGYVNMTIDHDLPVQIWFPNVVLNKYVRQPHILGPYSYRSLQLNFCTRDDVPGDGNIESKWPRGEYCVFKYGSNCPAGFQESSAMLGDYHLSWSNTDGVIPHVKTDDATSGTPTFHFCCHEIQAEDDSIQTFPNSFPFIMLKNNTSGCPIITGMKLKNEMFYFVEHTKMFEIYGSNNVFQNTGNGYEKLELCFYEQMNEHIRVRECLSIYGSLYSGTMNYSMFGKPCIDWFNVIDVNTFRYSADDHNYCRTSSSKRKPYCWVDVTETGTSKEQTIEECDIPLCELDPALEELDCTNKPVYSSEDMYNIPQNRWIQVDLEENVEVHAIKVWLASATNSTRVTVSENQWDFIHNGARQCVEDSFIRPGTYLYECYRPIIGQYVTFWNIVDPAYDAESVFKMLNISTFYKRGVCSRRLGLISGGIRDFQLGGGSAENKNLFDDGRLYHVGSGWCSNNAGQNYFEIDTIAPTAIHGFELQGTRKWRYDVNEVTVQYGINKDHMTSYLDGNGEPKRFHIDERDKSDMVHRFLVYRAFVTRHIRVIVTLPVEGPICMKMELIGCPKRIIRDTTCLKPDAIDVGYEVKEHTDIVIPRHPVELESQIECLEECNKIQCLSFTYIKPYCKLLYLSRYNPHFEHLVMSNRGPMYKTYTRLCISDVRAHDDCNALITSPAVIESPLYPQYYGQLAKCVWTFQFPRGKYPRLQFLHLTLAVPDKLSDLRQKVHFDVSVGNCRDMLSFGEFNIDADFSNIYRNSMFISSTPDLTLTLKSCARYSKAAAFNFIINVTYSDIPGCGFLHPSMKCESENGMIASRGYPTSIVGQARQSWHIEGRRGQYVELHIQALYFPDSSSDCLQHSITLEDLSLQYTFTELGKYCDSRNFLEPIKSNWHTMLVTFQTRDDTIANENGIGFLAEYKLVQFVQNLATEKNLDCSDGWEYYNQSCYQLFSENDGLSWLRAEELCTKFDGHLVSLQSRGELDFIHSFYIEKWTKNITDGGDFYIGLKKSNYGGYFSDYEWTDGSPATFLAWNKGTGNADRQPNGLNIELCTFLRLSSILSTENWHDVTCAFDRINHYICEKRILNNATDYVAHIVPFARIFSFSYEGFLHCGSGEMTQLIFGCDGIPNDCFDNSDESPYCVGVFGSCPPNGFRCNDDECIASHMLCDFNKDCSNGKDEERCVYQQCTYYEWECTSGQCIPNKARCDVTVDCLDGSDEEDCAICQGQTFQCYDRKCLTEARTCDSFIDCTGQFYEDELDRRCIPNLRSSCSEMYAFGQRLNGTYLITHDCNQDSFQVECRFGWNGGQPLVETVLHHNAENMLSWENEVNFRIKYSATREQIELIKYNSSHCKQYIKVGCQNTFNVRFLPFGWNNKVIWNINENCDYCPFVNQCPTIKRINCNRELAWTWLNESYYEVRYDEGYICDKAVLPILGFKTQKLTSSYRKEVQLTVGPLICEDNLRRHYRDLMVCRNEHTTPIDHKCVLDMDINGDTVGCRDLSHLEDCEHFVCPTIFLKCPLSFCIPTRFMCDGTKHCPGGEDEDVDECSDHGYCEGLYHCRGTPICIPRSQVCDGISHCPRRDDEATCIDTCQVGCKCTAFTMICTTSQFTTNITVNSQNANMKSLTVYGQMFNFSSGHLYPFPLLNTLNVSHCEIKHMDPFQFNSTKNLVTLDVSHNEMYHLMRHTFHGLVNLRTLLLKGNPLTIIDSLAFSNLSSIRSLDLSGFALDLVEVNMFYGLGSLEMLNISKNGITLVTEQVFKPLNTLRELDIRGTEILQFDQEIFFGLKNLALMYTDSFTLCCVRPSSLSKDKCISPKNEFSSCDDLMRNEVLRVSIWTTGIAAFIGNIVVLIIRFFVERESRGKTYSIFVSNLSIADSLMGIYLLIIATTDTLFRGSYVLNDYSWRNGDLCKMAGSLATVGSEGSVLFLCLITLERLLVVKFPYGNVTISRRACVALCASVWVAVFALAVVPLLIYPSFYSRSAVCLALPLTRDRPEGWQYGIGVFIVFNLLAFLLMATAQIVIYLEISASRRKVASRGRRMDMRIARKLFFVAITDFMCWFPIGLMGLLALNGQLISGEVYAWVAVFVLPINSAINPFLYTLGSSLSQMKLTIKDKFTIQRRDNKIEKTIEMFNSDLLVSGKGKKPAYKLNMSLDKYLAVNRLDIKKAYVIALRLNRALELLHRTELVHGSLNSSAVMMTTSSKGKIKRVVLKSSPRFSSEEEAFTKDVYDFGEILKQIVRNLSRDEVTLPSTVRDLRVSKY